MEQFAEKKKYERRVEEGAQTASQMRPDRGPIPSVELVQVRRTQSEGIRVKVTLFWEKLEGRDCE